MMPLLTLAKATAVNNQPYKQSLFIENEFMTKYVAVQIGFSPWNTAKKGVVGFKPFDEIDAFP
jgi:hypothetical protein